MTFTVTVTNIKCGGCANSIHKKLIDSSLADGVEVDIDQGVVRIDGDPTMRPEVVAALAGMGYPESGSVEGVRAAAAKAMSFVSCAVGRIDNVTSGRE